MLNPPTIWLTINPCDLHDPIVQLFAGEDINIDQLWSCIGPSKEQRAKNIASDPYAAAKFFHFIICTTIHTLFGVDATAYQLKTKTGIFGRIMAYFGTVESQNRGSLHLHMLLWLQNAPPSHKIKTLLKTKEFREKLQKFISANFRSHLPGFESLTSIKNIPSEDDIAWSHPPDPDEEGYKELESNLERRVARCRAGWIAAHTTMLCLWFDSPTLGPRFPIPRPIVLLSGRIALHWVTSHHIGSHHSMSGHVTARQVTSQHVRSHHIALGRVTSHCVALHRVTSHCIRSRHIALGCVALHRVASGRVSCAIIRLHCIVSGHIRSGQLPYYWVTSHYYQPCLVRCPSLLLFCSFARSSPPLPAKV